MGGAQRRDRAVRQQSNRSASRAVSAARGGGGNRNVIIGVVVVVIVAAAVIGGVLLSQHRQQQTQATGGGVRGDLHVSTAGVPTTKVDPSNATDQLPGGGVVQVGSHSAPVTIDMYEDFICPYCDECSSNRI
ncbi:MAG: hypothetical protein J2O49_02140, partial [Sciscionella sp.]|nr:hypothetical protein [Sciscionella sp.]